MILEFTTEQEAKDCLNYIEGVLAPPYWQSLGYLVEGSAVVGKNAGTGQDEPTKGVTDRWDEVSHSPDNTFYFNSLRTKGMEAGLSDLTNAGFNFIEKERPIAWIEGSNTSND